MPSERFNFLDQRPLFREDLNRAEKSRSNQRRMEVQKSAPQKAAEEADTPEMTSRLSNLRPKAETRSKVVSRLADNLMNPQTDTRLQNESVVPDADWYPRVHSSPIHQIAERTGIHPERVATASAAMSPQNDPTSERAAASTIAEAESRNQQFHISQQFKEVLPDRSPVQEISPGSVGFSEMTPEQIRDASKAEHRDSGIVQADVDLKGLAKAGTNKVAGVRGIRGASLTELAPPSSAPKVHTYGRHSYSFGVPHKTDTGKGSNFSPTDNTVAEEIRFRATHAATQMPGQLTIPVNDMHDDHIEMTKDLHDHLTSRGAPVRGQQIGKSVRVRDLHPAAVLAMSHPDVSQVHEDGDRMQRLAKVSSNLPTVMDSWANADVHGYATQDPKAAKPTGSNTAGYWGTKSLADGSPIVSEKDPRVTAAGLQHAEYDSLYRDAAKKVTDTMGMDVDYPSTAAQAGRWTELRRGAGADSQFNASKRQEAKSAKSPKKDKIKGQQEMKFPGWEPQ
jgi:hypothetical protein